MKLKKSDLDEFCSKAGVKVEKKYYIRLIDKIFKFVIDDEDLRSWSMKYLALREIHIYVEQLQPQPEPEPEPENVQLDELDSEFEDSDFIIGNELSDDDDDVIFERNVLDVASDLGEIDESNLVKSATFVTIRTEQPVVGDDRGKQPIGGDERG